MRIMLLPLVKREFVVLSHKREEHRKVSCGNVTGAGARHDLQLPQRSFTLAGGNAPSLVDATGERKQGWHAKKGRVRRWKKCVLMWRASPKISSINCMAPTAPPGARPLPRSKTSSWVFARYSPRRCSTRVWPGKRPLPTSSRRRHASALAVSSRWLALTTTHASSKHGPARPRRPSRKVTVPAVGGLFFPHSKSLGLEQSDASPAVMQQLTYAGTVSRSFAEACDILTHLTELTVSVQQVERVNERVGGERIAG